MSLLDSHFNDTNEAKSSLHVVLSDSRAVFELLDVLPEPIILLDHGLCVEFTNREYSKMFEVSSHPKVAGEFADLIVERIRDLGHLEDFTIEQRTTFETHIVSVRVARLPEADRVLVTLSPQPKTDKSLLVEAAGEVSSQSI